MLVLEVKAVSGMTIEECIEDCLTMSNKLGCMISIDINDIPMIITDSDIYGDTRDDRVKTFAKQYRDRLNEQELA